jgi:hypothetical protein
VTRNVQIRGGAVVIGHYGIGAFIAGMASGVVYELVGHGSVLLGYVAALIAIFGMLALITRMLVHDVSLCELCIAGAPVLDPQGAVKHNRWLLKAFHWERVNAIATLAVIAWLFTPDLRKGAIWRGWDTAGDVVAFSLISAVLYLTWVHYRLKPWCPYCKRGPGGRGGEFISDGPGGGGKARKVALAGR